MNIVVQGTKEFEDYNVFLRAIGVAMSGMQQNDTTINIYSVGPSKVNSMVLEFCNLSERSIKSRGKKIKHYKVHPSWVKENIEYINYFIYLSRPKQAVSKLVAEAEINNIEVGIFSY